MAKLSGGLTVVMKILNEKYKFTQFFLIIRISVLPPDSSRYVTSNLWNINF